MKSQHAVLPFLGLLLGGIAAQSPVPTRLATLLDGPASGYPEPVTLKLEIDTVGMADPALRMTGGIPLGAGAILLGTRTAEVELPQGALLLVEPLVVVAGELDANGAFGLPLDVLHPGFVGLTLHAQGLVYRGGMLPVETFQMSPRLTTTFVAGNAQPPLDYDGPPLTATLLAKAEQDLAPVFETYVEVLAPTAGYDLRVDATDVVPGVTRVYLVLEAPDPEKGLEPDPTRVRLTVPLGVLPEARIDLLVEQRIRGQQVPPVALLAAVLERDF
jgi:hypothetical protein